MPERDLDAMRVRLAGIDREIMDLALRRRELAQAIGQVKQTRGLPIRDFAHEKEVIGRARLAAAGAGLDPALAEELMVLLIRSSLAAQEQDRVQAAGAGEGRRVLIIGGAGRMGSWFGRFLASQGFTVEVADPAGAVPGWTSYDTWQEAGSGHDVVVVAAPLRAAAEVLTELASRPPPGLIFDIGSLKSPLRAGLEALAAAGAAVTSIHPMFGPDAELLSGRHVVFVDVGVPQATAAAKELFASTMAAQVDMDLEAHDRLVAYILGLSHALNIAFFTALADSGEKARDLAALSSTTFDAQLAVAGAVAAENPSLYFEIQSLNAHSAESLGALVTAVTRLQQVVAAADEDGFRNLMERGYAYMRDVHRG